MIGGRWWIDLEWVIYVNCLKGIEENQALRIHNKKISEIMEFQQKLAEADLDLSYGPAFADSYSYDEKLRISDTIKMIRRLHRQGNKL